MAEQLYLAVELRCNLDNLQFDIAGGCDRNTFLEMDDNEAERYLRQSLVRNDYGKETIKFNDNLVDGKINLTIPMLLFDVYLEKRI